MNYVKTYNTWLSEKEENAPYFKGIGKGTIDKKKAQMKKQAAMDDDDPAAYKELPGDTKGKKLLKTSQHTKKYDELYGKNEAMLGVLGGEHPLQDFEMRKEVVEPLMGKDYEAFIMFRDKDYQRQLDDIKRAYKVQNGDWKRAGWRLLYSSRSGQGEAWTCPENQIIKATILDRGGIVGALYMKPDKVLK